MSLFDALIDQTIDKYQSFDKQIRIRKYAKNYRALMIQPQKDLMALKQFGIQNHYTSHENGR